MTLLLNEKSYKALLALKVKLFKSAIQQQQTDIFVGKGLYDIRQWKSDAFLLSRIVIGHGLGLKVPLLVRGRLGPTPRCVKTILSGHPINIVIIPIDKKGVSLTDCSID